MIELKDKYTYLRIEEDHLFGVVTTAEVSKDEVNSQGIPESYVAFKGNLNSYKVGRKVVVTNMRTGQKERGEITVWQGGIPVEIRTNTGEWIPIFGLLIELLPIVERLIDAIKSLFKKRK